jgi:two-component system CheB/CheR fusion protein
VAIPDDLARSQRGGSARALTIRVARVDCILERQAALYDVVRPIPYEGFSVAEACFRDVEYIKAIVERMPTAAAETFRVVCLGGSAGALEAYLGILRSIPADSGLAFVVAPHRSLQNAHLLPEILASATAMPVIEVKQGMALEANRVFIMPPGQDMTIDGDKFGLQTRQKPTGWPITISLFLLSLAEAYGDRSVAVILSGMDHDGSVALQAIKAAGGVTFAQSNPEFDSMPRNAVATGYVDFILPPAEISKALLALAQADLSGRREGQKILFRRR